MKAISKLTQIKELEAWFDNRNITNKEFTVICEHISKLKQLKSLILILEKNKIRKLLPLAEVLKNLTELRKLHITLFKNEYIESIPEFADALKKLEKLKELYLDLSYCRLWLKDFIAIARALRHLLKLNLKKFKVNLAGNIEVIDYFGNVEWGIIEALKEEFEALEEYQKDIVIREDIELFLD